MDARQRFNETMHFGTPDRVPYREWFWPQTIERWYEEGLPRDVKVEDHFGYDPLDGIPIHMGMHPVFEEVVLEETDEYIVMQNTEGIVSKALKEGTAGGWRMSMDQRLRYPIHDRASFKEFKKRFDPADPVRQVVTDWEVYRLKVADRHFPLSINAGSIYGWIRDWMGVENLSVAIYDDPAWVEEMMEWVTEFIITMMTSVLEQVPEIDCTYMWEDMAYKGGPLISPRHFKELMVPRYRRITDLLRSYGVDVVLLDSDGDVRQLIPLWLEGGVNGIFPMEVAAGMDIVALRKEYGRDLLMIGGIDKREIAKGKDAIECEVMKKAPFMLEHGGWTPGIDHCVPPDVSYQNYCYYLNLIKKLAEGR